MPDNRDILARNDWIAQLPEPVVAALAEQCRRRQLKNGEVLYHQGDDAEALYGIISGSIRISTADANGRDLIATHFESGDWLGEISMFDGLPRMQDATAIGDTEVMVLERQRFQQLLDEQPELYRHFVPILCRKLRLAVSYAEGLMFMPLPARLAVRLLELSKTYGENVAEGIKITLHLPQDDLAKMVGVSRQMISKQLKQWEAEGLIAIAYGRITLTDPEALATRALASD